MKKVKGQLLVEVLVAATLLVLVLVAVTGLVVQSIKAANQAKNKVLATRYGQEAIEWFKGYRDWMGWDNFYDELANDDAGTPNEVVYCLEASLRPPISATDFSPFTNYTDVGSCTLGPGFTKVATVNLNPPGAGPQQAINVSLTVWWDSGQNSVTLASRLSRWD